jgi:2-polyprenyl-3-methyl-5-hydroxy-6-metoxy-1,4-benzoquinol methylase
MASQVLATNCDKSLHGDSDLEVDRPLKLMTAHCCVCDDDDAEPIAVGEDFEYHTSPDSFVAMQCRQCGLVYLNPRPDVDELSRIYPPTYHAFDFSAERFGIIYKVRRWLEARRLLSWCRDLPDDARILDVGCGDGFHLQLLRDFGKPTWRLEGIDLSSAAVECARKSGLEVHEGSVEEQELPNEAYDLVILIQTIEHIESPARTLTAIRMLLRRGGKLVIVTDNTNSLDFGLFRGRHWGGYHFPRHWNLFNRRAMTQLAEKVDLDVEKITTQVSPVNWVYSFRNLLLDWGAPRWLYNRFSLQSPVTLALFTALDNCLQLFRRGALLRTILRRSK